MNIVYWGNFSVPFTTENEVAKALEALGHTVTRHQEGGEVPSLDADLVLWTRTADLSKRTPITAQRQFLIEARRAGVPTCSYHLDRWHGLREHGREASVWEQPFFHTEFFFSTDGAHDAEWAAAGVNHFWSPPGVSEFECVPGTSRDDYRSQVCFIGSWRHYHNEWPHRTQLASHLQARGAAMWPKPGEHAIRQNDLRDLVASSTVIVGDSCLAPRADGGPMHHYNSDRLPELIGRGGFLLHPYVEGVTDGTVFTDGEHLATWTLGDFDDLDRKIDYYLAHPDERERIAKGGAAHVAENLTYTVLLRKVLEAVCPS